MLYGLLVTLFVFVCLLLILVILIQQGKGGLGLGSIGGGAQMLFGGSGGQDVFQKITWTLGAIFMAGSLGLFILGSRSMKFTAVSTGRTPARRQAPAPMAPAAKKIPMPAAAKKELPVQPAPAKAKAPKELPKKEAKK